MASHTPPPFDRVDDASGQSGPLRAPGTPINRPSAATPADRSKV
ncbi:hypothetical protein [Halobellus ruber]|nr:hypothetical protein [Halobellus ruber]